MMKYSLLLLTASLAPLKLLDAAEPTEPTEPNIVILYADDMGYGDLGANNPDSKIPTPNLDRLAEQGMLYVAKTPESESSWLHTVLPHRGER